MEIASEELHNAAIDDYTLSVIPLRLRDKETIAKTVAVWARIATEKAKECRDLEEKRRFQDCAWICEVFERTLTGSLGGSKIYLCVDQTQKPWGLIEVSEKPTRIHIDFLVTHPNNIRSHVNKQEVAKVEGAGSLLLEKAEHLARTLGKTAIDLFPLFSAIGFYLKNGFTQRQNGDMIKLIPKIDALAFPLLAVA